MTIEEKNEILRKDLQKTKEENEILKQALSELKIDYDLLLSDNAESIIQAKESIEAVKLMKLHYEDAINRIDKLEIEYNKLIKLMKESKLIYDKRMNSFMRQLNKTSSSIEKNERKTKKKINKK